MWFVVGESKHGVKRSGKYMLLATRVILHNVIKFCYKNYCQQTSYKSAPSTIQRLPSNRTTSTFHIPQFRILPTLPVYSV